MGLDIYLLEKEVEERNNARDKAYEDLYTRKEKDEITEEEYEVLRKDLPKFESYPEVASKAHPDFWMNRRYLRSSYNGGGFNYAVPELLGDAEHQGFYTIFAPILPEDEEYLIELHLKHVVALRKCKKNADQVATQLRGNGPFLRVQTVEAESHLGDAEHLWAKPPTSDEALAWYREQLARPESSGPFGESWSNAKGTFWGKPDSEGFNVLASVPGKDILGRPCVHLVYRNEAAGHYAMTADVAGEFCDEAIALIKRDGVAYIHWSA
jgi:hypothetical protein